MKLLVVAGEPSGDLRAAELLRELRKRSEIHAFGMGGDRMLAEGVDLQFHHRDLSVMGFLEVLTSLPKLLGVARALKRRALAESPDAVVLVDYPGFNLRFASWAHSQGLRVIYYVSPQLWAWGKGRMRKVRSCVDLMITLFRFERDLYRNNGVNVFWSGHPLVDEIPEPLPEEGADLALLPGSRSQEVRHLLPPMIGAFELLRDRGLVERASIAVSPYLDESAYGPVLDHPRIRGCTDIESALLRCRAAVVCSGTATLETALYGRPFVIGYRTSLVSYLLARMLVRDLDHIGMANLVAGKEVAPELVQRRASAEGLAEALDPLLRSVEARERAREGLEEVRKALGPPGSASRAAARITEELGG